MIITYHGHSCFKLKGKKGSVVCDPFDGSYVGFSSSTLSADLVTVSHQHPDHNAIGLVKGTERRKTPFVVDFPGEYEVGGVSVFASKVFHDSQQGEEKGDNLICKVLIDGIRVCHLGDLGHELTKEQIDKIGMIDVLFIPIGGKYTIDKEMAVKVARSLEPSVLIPMHYKTSEHSAQFSELSSIEDFIKEFGTEVRTESKLNLDKDRLPEEMELVVLTKS
jgi:L-ascorbate metabolism protein UlaG (beta-lactamase superfamily)